ncbi:STAS domain-containing protein [Streptacidiphilus neutrinimicus]|uniref:STAS domain-containing protein n=1 Tax=Streptacidiphilus neutrinimicus TaxID=105420 RepID=UPI0005A88928|nr:STAS domain-containing protein [Streptacidiphilus neutrinimicus]
MQPLTRTRARGRAAPRNVTTETRDVGGAVLWRITGEVDADDAASVEKALMGALQQVRPSQQLWVELADVRFFGAAGLNVLLRLRRAAAEQRTPLVLIAPAALVRRVLQLTDTRPCFQTAG